MCIYIYIYIHICIHTHRHLDGVAAPHGVELQRALLLGADLGRAISYHTPSPPTKSFSTKSP